ncbi:MAG TPA: DUF1552 domain-containing protein [Polyangiaceae bacterium]|nr:DUF1552 domain-containing protein [Polyangiaceae bacterium]
MNRKNWLSRRNVLRGAGVGLALPWLESLCPAPVQAQAQAAAKTKRYVFMYFSNGVARAFWPPMGEGAGAAWKLSGLLEPLQAVKQHVQVLSNVGQTALFGGNPNPSHSQLCAPTTSCTVNDKTKPILGGPSVDQVLAQNIGGATPFKSLQLGCSTMPSYPDGQHPAISRSISWAASDQPLYKEVNPQAVFDNLIKQLAPGGATDPAVEAAAKLRQANDLSVLDYVLDEANALNAKLSASDKRRLEQFLDSVQQIEKRTKEQGNGMVTNKMYTRPTMSASYTERANIQTVDINDPTGYSRNTHAELMNDLITMAFETDLTRVVSHMLDDARSDYHYHFLKQRNFQGQSSVEIDAPLTTPLQGDLLGLHALQHDGDNNNGFATVNHWFVQKFASLLDKLSKAMEPDGSGKSVLDNTIVVFMSGMQGSNHQANNLPIVLGGSGGGVFKTDYHNNFASEVKLADVHLTVLQSGFGLSNVAKLGNSGGIVPGLLV